MKIQGPGSKPPVGETQGPDGPGSAKGKDGAFADKVGGAPPGGGGDPIAAIAREVQAGTLTPQQAVQKIVDLATPGSLPPAMREKLRAQLESLVKEDPFLAAKAKRIGSE